MPRAAWRRKGGKNVRRLELISSGSRGRSRLEQLALCTRNAAVSSKAMYPALPANKRATEDPSVQVERGVMGPMSPVGGERSAHERSRIGRRYGRAVCLVTAVYSRDMSDSRVSVFSEMVMRTYMSYLVVRDVAWGRLMRACHSW